MGCYMSVPDSKVYVTEGKGKNFTYATASCQGWRREQEDAEDCLPDFDTNASLFILCDGHGGAEVAKYTVEHLPNFIKNHPLYQEGKYKEALERAFIDFDALLRTDKVMAELHRIAFDDDNQKSESKQECKVLDLKDGIDTASESPGPSSSTGPSSSSNQGSRTAVDDVDTETLRREAQVPLKELIDQMSAKSGIDYAKRNSLLQKYNASPVVPKRSSEDAEENGEACASSSSDVVKSKVDEPGPSSSKSNSIDEPAPGSSSFSKESIKEALIRKVLEHYFSQSEDDESSDGSEFEGESSSDDDDDDDDDDGDDECDEEKGERSSNKKLLRRKRRPTDDDQDSTSEDSDDEDDSDDDEDEDDEEEDEDNEDEENDDEEKVQGSKRGLEAEDDESDWRDIDSSMKPQSRQHKPGLDSGCTVVVALIKDDKLYVASAGDSRCIVMMRDGQYKPMSFDHKPENHKELERINKAGGRVSEGRVNGGLNLSRALGDFTYKNAQLEAKDQMITPCPDVKIAELDPEKVEYVFLACDGIWNSMKNVQVINFIGRVAKEVNNNLVDICMKLFGRCIAPSTDGDGTGCDNMTSIIVRFDKPSVKSTNGESDVEQEVTESETSSQKRSNNDEEGGDSNELPTKRRCLSL